MPDYSQIVASIANHAVGRFRAATAEELDLLRGLGLPESVLEFYEANCPDDCVEGQVRLWSPRNIVEENTELVPGCHISKLGFIVFSTTLSGDTYCFDMNSVSGNGTPAIVLISHEMDDEELAGLTTDEYVKPIANDLVTFLDLLSRQALDEEPIE